MAKNRVAGTAYLKLTNADGAQYNPALRGGWTVMPSRFEKEGISGQDDVHGYKEMPKVPYIEGDITTTADLDIAAIEASEDITATIELANGHVYVGTEGWRAGTSEIDTEEGKLKLKLEFKKLVRIQ